MLPEINTITNSVIRVDMMTSVMLPTKTRGPFNAPSNGHHQISIVILGVRRKMIKILSWDENETFLFSFYTFILLIYLTRLSRSTRVGSSYTYINKCSMVHVATNMEWNFSFHGPFNRENKTPAKEHFNQNCGYVKKIDWKCAFSWSCWQLFWRPNTYDSLSWSPKQKRPKESQNKDSAARFRSCRASSATPDLPCRGCWHHQSWPGPAGPQSIQDGACWRCHKCSLTNEN